MGVERDTIHQKVESDDIDRTKVWRIYLKYGAESRKLGI